MHFIKDGLYPEFHCAFRNSVFLETLKSTFAKCMEKQSKVALLSYSVILNGVEKGAFLLCLRSTMPREVFFVFHVLL